jgi:uncharacterized protein
MKPRAFDPTRLDVAAFAQAAGVLSGEWPLADLDRLAACRPAQGQGEPAQPVVWSVEGEQRKKPGAQPETWLHVRASVSIPLECQRCLQPVVEALDVERSLRFVSDEAAAAELDAESEDDVLALTRALDLRLLLEDELLLALPIVPRHDVCPQPLQAAPAEPVEQPEARPNPFAALQALKRGPSGGGNSH